jgi:hypothetical protein
VLIYKGWPEFLRWCTFEELSEGWVDLYKSGDEDVSSPYASYAKALDEQYPGWQCAYKESTDVNAKEYAEACDRWDGAIHYRFCGADMGGTFKWEGTLILLGPCDEWPT